MRLKDKVAIVTGGAMGIGKGIVTVFAREGAKVIIADINEEAGRATEKELRDQGFEVFFVRCDVSNEEDVKAMIQKAIERYGALHILVNNAGIGVYKSITEATREEFERCLAVNLIGPFLCSKYAIPHIRAAGGGSIINIASVHAVQNVGGTAPYAA